MKKIATIKWDKLPIFCVRTTQNLVSKAQINYHHALNEILAISSFCASTELKVEHPLTKSVISCNNYFITIAGTGERKSSTQKLLLEKYYHKVNQMSIEYHKQLEKYSLESKNKLKTNDAWGAGIEKIDKKPVDPAILVDDMTQEGLFYKLAHGNIPICGIWSAEGGTFFSSIGMNKDNKGKMFMTLNKLWSGESVTSTRVKHGGTKMIPRGSLVSLNLAMQETVFIRNVATRENEEEGFTSRILICQPDSMVGTREATLETEDTPYLDSFTSRIKECLVNVTSSYVNSGEHAPNKLQVIYLTKEAMEIFLNAYNRIEVMQQEGGFYEHYRGFASKMGEHILKLAGALAWIDKKEEIDADIINAAIELTQWYMKTQKKLIDKGDRTENQFEGYKDKTLRWLNNYIEKNPDAWHISQKQLKTEPWRRVPIAAHELLVHSLVEDGILEDIRYQEEVMISGKKCKTAFKICKDIPDLGNLKLDPNDKEALNV